MDQNKCCKQNLTRERISLWPEARSDRQSNNITRITTEGNGFGICLPHKHRISSYLVLKWLENIERGHLGQDYQLP